MVVGQAREKRLCEEHKVENRQLDLHPLSLDHRGIATRDSKHQQVAACPNRRHVQKTHSKSK